MIPGKIVRFLEERANVGFAGTRDRNLVPSGYRVCGWQVDGTGRTLTIFVPQASEAPLVGALLDDSPIAVTIEEVGTHETYQIKGRYLRHRPVLPTEIDIANRARERFARSLRSLYADERVAAALTASVPAPSVAVEVEARELFLQTPGPGAGGRIIPPPEEAPSAR
jgi:hypothetical protein